MDDMPTFTGGLVGYFSYDYIKYSEPKLELTDKEQQDFRDLDLMLFNDVIAFDHYRQKVLLITGVMTDDLEKSYKPVSYTHLDVYKRQLIQDIFCIFITLIFVTADALPSI